MRAGTVKELIEMLEGAIEDNEGEDLPLRVAYQPNYPLATMVGNVRVVEEEGSKEKKLWLACDSSAPYNESPYASHEAWEEA